MIYIFDLRHQDSESEWCNKPDIYFCNQCVERLALDKQTNEKSEIKRNQRQTKGHLQTLEHHRNALLLRVLLKGTTVVFIMGEHYSFIHSPSFIQFKAYVALFSTRK